MFLVLFIISIVLVVLSLLYMFKLCNYYYNETLFSISFITIIVAFCIITAYIKYGKGA
jgi:hypothetical protein